MTATTLNQIILGAASQYQDHPVMRYKAAGRWHVVPFADFRDRVARWHAALVALELASGSRAAILSENRPEWVYADCACLTAGLVDVPIYPTLTAEQTAFILRDSGASLVFVSSRQQLDKVLSIRSQIPDLRHIVAFDADAATASAMSIEQFESAGANHITSIAEWAAAAARAASDDLATVIYTSGTTGDPKGAMLSHGNIASNVAAAMAQFELTSDDECLSFLPLCHIFERMAGYYCMLAAGATINYATNADMVAVELREVRPTVLMSVPRLYEKIHARVLESVRTGGALSRQIFEWALRVGDGCVSARLARRRPSLALRLQHRVADRLVFAKLRRRTGARIRFCVSGGAPLDPGICRFFLAAGITLLEGYGLTETSPVVAVNTFTRVRPGTVGPVLPGVEVEIADDGEILVRGSGVMQGYFHQPDATAEAIDREGWFHTGDIGAMDGDGFLRITDRKKDLIKTAGGKFIAPQPIEATLKQNRFVSGAVMLGDRRPYPIMLLVPDADALRDWMTAKGLAFTDLAAAIATAPVREKIEREARKSLRALAQFETPKKFVIVPADFSVDAGDLTPTLKVRRAVVAERYRQQIDALYAEA